MRVLRFFPPLLLLFAILSDSTLAQKNARIANPPILPPAFGGWQLVGTPQTSNNPASADPTNVAALAQTRPYDTVFNLPFRTIVMTVYSFSNADGVAGLSASPARLKAEENEFYQLTK